SQGLCDKLGKRDLVTAGEDRRFARQNRPRQPERGAVRSRLPRLQGIPQAGRKDEGGRARQLVPHR
ncbi:hypothetical protein IscW_ISCW009146, partial [Ixodes scapularis]